jgi:bifunctional ADP-heptose synthase (sugar kinase/adenylyltransferase)
LALAADIEPLTAAQMANYAAGLVVRRIGNAVVTPDELAQGIAHGTD